ncbi:MAG TPA: DUF4105 domain-containing protein [Gemmatimonadaceae bacterium]|nr:DUF4105 domain-containing protein [Gemmatimonadaceae bacterium]
MSGVRAGLACVVAWLGVSFAAAPVSAQQMVARPAIVEQQPAATAPVVANEPGSQLDITLITFGLGEEVFERFGHNAIWVHDNALGTDAAYDWGNFDFDQPHFLQRFLTGDTRYWMQASEAGSMLEAYQRIGRPITLQRLAMTPAQKLALRDFLRWNALEENKYYRYDYFVDNCSTRLRDALDRVLGGEIRAATDTAHTALSYRRESVRLTDGDKPVQVGIDIALGRPADKPLTVWESFFIPMRLRDGLRELTVPAGPGGARVPLVSDERYIAPIAGTAVVPERETSPRLLWRLLLVGVVLAGLVAGLRIMAISRRGAAWGLALFAMAWSLACGAVGVILILAWTATLHVFWAWNENLLQLSPLSLALVVLIPMSLLARKSERAARMTAFVLLAIAGVGALLALIPGGQENRAIVALVLPVHLAIAWALALPTPVKAAKYRAPKPPKEKPFTI